LTEAENDRHRALEALAKAAMSKNVTVDQAMSFVEASEPRDIIALIAEVRALRSDAERYRWAISAEGNAEQLYISVASCGAESGESITAEIDSLRGAK
jgi:capsule polysaccharide export protein KpsE/RkpR